MWWLAASVALAADIDSGVIRLAPSDSARPPAAAQESVEIEEPRRGFDYESFEARLESLWFQRKAFLADGRIDDASEQLERIRAFGSEEGVSRLEHLAGALLAEARGYLDEGNQQQTFATLDYAETFDSGRPQTHLARAAAHWKFGTGYGPVGAELFRAVRAAWLRGVQDLSLLHRVAFVLGFALSGAGLLFALAMLLRYQAAFRHLVEERLAAYAEPRWCAVAGWAALGLPLLLWFGAGWAAMYWIVITFTLMGRAERWAALGLLGASSLTVPVHNLGVALYGTTADPAVRTTLAAVDGGYDPDRIVRLLRLVESHPNDPVYHFLLAGLYKNGRYFEEAFVEYRAALELNPDLVAAHINIGNIFYTTGQYAEAVANYRKALERDPRSFLAHFNLHLAQSESFRFADAEHSLHAAREIDARRAVELLEAARSWGSRPAAQDATLRMASVWESAVAGRQSLHFDPSSPWVSAQALRAGLLSPIGLVSLLGLAVCLSLAVVGPRDAPARRCIRCGRPFCHQCKSSREGREYCSQCLHLFVLRDGLAPGTRSRKLYEVERYERRSKLARKLVSLLLPGTGHLLRGRMGRGLLLLLLWLGLLVAAAPALLEPAGRLAGLELRPELLRQPAEVPLAFGGDPLTLVALLALPVIWSLGNVGQRVRREA